MPAQKEEQQNIPLQRLYYYLCETCELIQVHTVVQQFRLTSTLLCVSVSYEIQYSIRKRNKYSNNSTNSCIHI